MFATEPPQPAPPALTAPSREVFGRSVDGRPLVLRRIGNHHARLRVMVVGYVHGNEQVGYRIAQRLLTRPPVRGVEFLVVPSLNPDGGAADTRYNAHGVDLNRNSSAGWRHLAGGVSGPHPWSEPETRAIRRLILRERPRVALWFHQPLDGVDRPDHGGDVTLARRYARLARLPYAPGIGTRPGALTRWSNLHARPTTAFVVELPGGLISDPPIFRWAGAIRGLAASLKGR